MTANTRLLRTRHLLVVPPWLSASKPDRATVRPTDSKKHCSQARTQVSGITAPNASPKIAQTQGREQRRDDYGR